jgi:hypothetical protein
MLTEALQSLSKPVSGKSTIQAKRQASADIAAKISAAETRLEIPHSLPLWNPVRASARLAELERKLADKNPVPTAATAAPAAVARPVELTGDATLDKAIIDGGFRSQSHRNAALRLNHLIEIAAGATGATREILDSKIAAEKTNLANLS